MKEYKTPLGSFIGGWIIDRKICEDLIKFFEKNKKRQIKGMIGGSRPTQVDHLSLIHISEPTRLRRISDGGLWV